MQIYNIYQSGKNLYLDEKENPDNKIVFNKYESEQQTLRLISDGTLPPRLYWALRNPRLSQKYFILPLINNEDLIIGTDISATPGLWDMLLIGTDDYIIEGTDIDQSRLTYVSDNFGRLFVRDNFLEELDFEEQCSPTFEVFYDDILDKIAELEKGGASYAEIKKAVEEYLIKHPVETTVISVNKKTGKVELTAKDVGALSQDDVDDELSTESTNPIQNRAVATKIKELEESIPSEITVDDELSFESTNAVQNKVIAAKLKELEETKPDEVVGKDGVGVASAVINDNGELVLTYTDENITNLGKVVGENGKDGKDGQDGEKGQDGLDGKSAYQHAVDGDYEGTEEEFSKMLANGANGLTQAQAKALDDMFKKCAFTGDVSTEYEAFKTAFGLTGGGEVEPDTPTEPDEPIKPDNPDVTLTSISATYTGGNVVVGTSVNSLTGITVKATYSDGSTKNVTGYTLSGTITEGNNTITVSYGGKTTTFTVTGVAESDGETVTDTYSYLGQFANWFGADTSIVNDTDGDGVYEYTKPPTNTIAYRTYGGYDCDNPTVYGGTLQIEFDTQKIKGFDVGVYAINSDNEIINSLQAANTTSGYGWADGKSWGSTLKGNTSPLIIEMPEGTRPVINLRRGNGTSEDETITSNALFHEYMKDNAVITVTG